MISTIDFIVMQYRHASRRSVPLGASAVSTGVRRPDSWYWYLCLDIILLSPNHLHWPTPLRWSSTTPAVAMPGPEVSTVVQFIFFTTSEATARIPSFTSRRLSSVFRPQPRARADNPAVILFFNTVHDEPWWAKPTPPVVGAWTPGWQSIFLRPRDHLPTTRWAMPTACVSAVTSQPTHIRGDEPLSIYLIVTVIYN